MTAVTLVHADCRDALDALPPDALDACVTDPPYGLTAGAAGAKSRRPRTGYMGHAWDGSGVAFDPAVWRAVLRALRPGAYLLAFGAPRTYHRLAVAVEDAGFEVHAPARWVHPPGMPLGNRDLSKEIDRRLGAARARVRNRPRAATSGTMAGRDTRPGVSRARAVGYAEADGPIPVTPEAIRWHGWGTRLRPAHEPIVVARKPGGGPAAGVAGVDAGGLPAVLYHPRATAVEKDAGGVRNPHPTVKPVGLLRRLVARVTPPGGTVLDPFVGSGSTTVACVAEGRGCVGVDLGAEYLAAARRRVAAAGGRVE